MNDTPPSSLPTQRLITVTGDTQRRLDPDEVARALGAEPVPGVAIKGNPGPIALYALRTEVMRRLTAAGKSGPEAAPPPVQVPLSLADQRKLMALARAVTPTDPLSSAEQVASVLLSAAIAAVENGSGNNGPLLEAISRQLSAAPGASRGGESQ